MTELEFIDEMISKLKRIKSAIKKKDNLSEKAFNMDFRKNTQRQIEKANTNLNWQCMYLDKEKTELARFFKGSFLDVDTSPKEYNPSGFHKYKG